MKTFKQYITENKTESMEVWHGGNPYGASDISSDHYTLPKIASELKHIKVESQNYFHQLYEAMYKQTQAAQRDNKRFAKTQMRASKESVANIRPLLQAFLDPESEEMSIVMDTVNKTTKSKYEKLYAINRVKEMVDQITQGRQTEGSILKYILDYINIFTTKGQKSRKIETFLVNKAVFNFKEIAKETSKASSFEGSGYEEDFKSFFPKEISFELSPTRDVTQFIENYGNKRLTIQEKCNRTTFIRKNYEFITKTVLKGLDSQDEVKRLTSTMLGVIMVTGIRPGVKIGQTTYKDDNGNEINVPTFGASTLKPEHVEKITPDSVKFNFTGKAGSINLAEIDGNSELSRKVIQSLNTTYRQTKDMEYLFTTQDGNRIEYKHLKKYVNDNFGEISPTDFRKEVASREFYESLKRQGLEIYQEYKNMGRSEIENLKDTIVTRIINSLSMSVDKVKAKLSHDESSVNVAIDDYIDPRVIINFLNALNLEDEYEDIIINNKNVTLNFDVQQFIDYVQGKQ